MSWKEFKSKFKNLFSGNEGETTGNLPVLQTGKVDEPPADRPRLVPVVDIMENERELILTADVPGECSEDSRHRPGEGPR